MSVHRGLTRAALEFSDGGDVAPGLLLEPKRVDVGPVSLRQSDLETGAQRVRLVGHPAGGCHQRCETLVSRVEAFRVRSRVGLNVQDRGRAPAFSLP